MSRSMERHIPKPCHEDWSAMLPAEKGRHCASCQKTVVDFTNMSDAGIVRYMSRAGSHVCGRFMPDQLSRKLEEPVAPKRSRWPGWQLVFTGVLLTADAPHRVEVPVRTVLHQQPVTDIKRDTCVPGMLGEVVVPKVTVKETHLLGDTTMVALQGDVAVADPAPPPPDTSKPVPPPPVKCDDVFMGKVVAPRKTVTAVVDTIREIAVDTLTRIGILGPDKELMAPKKGLSVYPNPVNRGGIIRLGWPVQEGTFQVALFTAGGEMIQEREIVVGGPAQVDEWSLPAGLTPGMYVLRAVGRGKAYAQKVMVQ